MNAIDCPDGLARCERATVSVSRLATVPFPCNGPREQCACPWERLADCAYGCAAEGIELVLDRAAATIQLCAPSPDAAAFASPWPQGAGAAPAVDCEEGQRYLCADALIIQCGAGDPGARGAPTNTGGSRVVGRCLRGCFAQGASIDDDDVSREAAFATLCSR